MSLAVSHVPSSCNPTSRGLLIHRYRGSSLLQLGESLSESLNVISPVVQLVFTLSCTWLVGPAAPCILADLLYGFRSPQLAAVPSPFPRYSTGDSCRTVKGIKASLFPMIIDRSASMSLLHIMRLQQPRRKISVRSLRGRNPECHSSSHNHDGPMTDHLQKVVSTSWSRPSNPANQASCLWTK